MVLSVAVLGNILVLIFLRSIPDCQSPQGAVLRVHLLEFPDSQKDLRAGFHSLYHSLPVDFHNPRVTGSRSHNHRAGFHPPVDSLSLRVDSHSLFLSRVEKDKGIYRSRVDTIRSLLARQCIPDDSQAPEERVIEAAISNLRCLLAMVRCGICLLGSVATECLRIFIASKTRIISLTCRQFSRHPLRADQLHSQRRNRDQRRIQIRDQCRDQCRDRDRVVRAKDEADPLAAVQWDQCPRS